jgi:hypothetical protein
VKLNVWDRTSYMFLAEFKDRIRGTAIRGSIRDLAYWRCFVELVTLGREIIEVIMGEKER